MEQKEPLDYVDLQDKLNDVKALTAFMGRALMYSLSADEGNGEDTVTGAYLFCSHIQDEVSLVQETLAEYKPLNKTGGAA